MDLSLAQLFHGVTSMDEFPAHGLRVAVRLTAALVLGGAIGIERLKAGKSTGFRTCALVCMGAALFTMVPLEAGIATADLSRVIQGVCAGIGFLGAGAILKSDDHHVEGLTSAASVWVVAACGMAIGAGWIWPAVVATIMSWFVLHTGLRFEHWITGGDSK